MVASEVVCCFMLRAGLPLCGQLVPCLFSLPNINGITYPSATQIVVLRPPASEMQALKPHSDLLNENL